MKNEETYRESLLSLIDESIRECEDMRSAINSGERLDIVTIYRSFHIIQDNLEQLEYLKSDAINCWKRLEAINDIARRSSIHSRSSKYREAVAAIRSIINSDLSTECIKAEAVELTSDQNEALTVGVKLSSLECELMRCPQCHSANVFLVPHIGAHLIQCGDCR